MRRSRRLAIERLEDRLTPAGVPVLNSFITAPADIYMDFDGQGTTEPYDTDGVPTDFSTSEVADITRAHAQLALFFAPFNVNVTTVFTSARPKAWLMLGNNISGGYSFVNVFPNSKPESFNQSSDARNRVSGLAHEVGHNFGLSHQSAFNNLGVETADYISAVEPMRGFLMGVDYSGTVKKWSIGHTSNASGLQDDVAMIAGDLDNYGGDGFRPDDVGGTTATALPLPADGAIAIIERLTDVDAFSFVSTGGRVNVTVAPVVPSALDAILEVRDSTDAIYAVADTATNGQSLTLTLPAGTYTAFVKSKGNYADIGQYKLTVTEGAPEGFQTLNIGNQWHTGQTKYSAATGTWNVSGSGADIASSADAFHYVYRPFSGDGVIIARVTAMDNTNTSAKAGVMIRESLTPGSRHVSSFMQFGQGSQMVSRSSTNGSTATVGGGATTFTPRWTRLTKVGNAITSAWSANGTTWTNHSTVTINVGTVFYVGLAVTSREDEETNRTDDVNDAALTNVTITGFTDPFAVTAAALSAPDNVTAAPAAGNAVTVSWDAVSGATGTTIERSQDGGASFVVLGTTTASTFTDTNPLGAQQYWYRVRATSAAGRSDASALATTLNRPSAVRSLEFTSYTTTSIVLDWLGTDGETGFKVERSADAGATWTQIATPGKNIPSYTATGLAVGTAYSFRVTPTSAQGDGPAATIAGFSRLATVGGLNFGTVSATSVQLNWTAVPNATGYRIERSPDGTTFTTAGTVGVATTFTNTGLTAETEYYYRVIATGSATESSVASAVAQVGTGPVTPLALPWLAADIGTLATQKGMTSLTAGTFKVISGGADIWGSADAFRFTYQSLVGNGVITARVSGVENTGASAKLGVMIRETLNANSRHADVFLTPAGTLAMQSRSTTGGSTTGVGTLAGTLAAPYWVRLVRQGNVLTGHASPNGVTWTQVGSRTFTSLAQTLFIGLNANANSSTTLNTSTFDNVSINTIGVQSVVIGDGSPQRSRIGSISVSFSGVVSLGTDPRLAFTLLRTGGGGAVPFTVDLSGSTATTTSAKINFAELVDGEFTFTVVATRVTDASGFALGTLPGNVVRSFHRLFGDIDGNRTVDGADFAEFGVTFGFSDSTPGFNAAFDFNADGTIDGTDFAEFGARFGVSL